MQARIETGQQGHWSEQPAPLLRSTLGGRSDAPLALHHLRRRLSLSLIVRRFTAHTFMGAAHYIVLERKIDGLDTMMDGKSLSRHIESLDAAAGQLGIRPLSEFFSIAPESAAEFMEGEGMDAQEMELPPLQQFSAEEGLTTVRALLAHTQVHADHVAEDLHECERILSAAAQHGVGWHFEIDI